MVNARKCAMIAVTQNCLPQSHESLMYEIASAIDHICFPMDHWSTPDRETFLANKCDGLRAFGRGDTPLMLVHQSVFLVFSILFFCCLFVVYLIRTDWPCFSILSYRSSPFTQGRRGAVEFFWSINFYQGFNCGFTSRSSFLSWPTMTSSSLSFLYFSYFCIQ